MSEIERENAQEHFSIDDLKFCVIDLETTGGHHLYDKIIEVGLVHIDGTTIGASKNWIINPEIPIPEYVQKLTSLTQEIVRSAPTIEHSIDEVLAFIGDRILVAHNSSFDIPFLNSVLKRLKYPERNNHSLCTHLMTKYLIPGLLNTNLQYMCRLFNIPQGQAHRALDDALAAGHLLIHYLHIFRRKDIKKANQLYYPRLKFELDRRHFRADEWPAITELVKSTTSTILITLKGLEGKILFSLPFHCKNWDTVANDLKNFAGEECQGITIKLFGSWIEAFLHFSHHYIKMSTSERELAFRLLAAIHFSHKQFTPSYFQQIDITAELAPYEYVVLPHLIPEQLLIVSLNNIFQRAPLVFRYPGHKKKLSQYMNSRANKTKITHYKNPLLRECEQFLFTYLLTQKEEQRVFSLSGVDRLDQELKKFLEQKNTGYGFYESMSLIGPNQTQPLPGLLDEWLQIWSHAPFAPGTNYPVIHL